MKTPARPFSLILPLMSILPLAAASSAGRITRYITNRASESVTVVLETGGAQNGQFKVEQTREKEIPAGARNVPITIPGKDLYRIDFTLVSKWHPDKILAKGDRINECRYFAVDDDLSVEMQNSPFN